MCIIFLFKQQMKFWNTLGLCDCSNGIPFCLLAWMGILQMVGSPSWWYLHRLPKGLWIMFKSLGKNWLWGWAPKTLILCSAGFDRCSTQIQTTSQEGSTGERFKSVALLSLQSIHWMVDIKHFFLIKKNSVASEQLNTVKENPDVNVSYMLVLINKGKTWGGSVQL